MPILPGGVRRTYRIGLHVFPCDPFWVQVNEAMSVRLGEHLVPLDLQDPFVGPALGEDLGFVEDVLAQELDALVCVGMYPFVLERFCAAGLPLVYLFELNWTHPCLIYPTGLYDAARLAATFLAQELKGRGRILVADGYMEMDPNAGASRLAGIRDALASYPDITVMHSATSWRQSEAFPLLRAELEFMPQKPDAVLGLIDDLALAARDAARSLGIPDEKMLTVGINGDPLAIAAILQGSMSATVRTSPFELADQASEFAFMAARREPWTKPFCYSPELITASNAAAVAAENLVELASMPSRLVGVNRRAEQDRLKQLELSAAINRRVGALLDRQQLIAELEDLIRANYGYDVVRILRWSAAGSQLSAEYGSAPGVVPSLTVTPDTPEAEVLGTGKALFIPDASAERRWPRDPAFPGTRTRALLPIQLGDEMLGLLDLHSRYSRSGLREELVGLQATADQLAIAMRNAELYDQAVQARAVAEKADQLKTRLLANVSHELRTPLNIIMGYGKSALAEPSPYGAALPGALRDDLGHICHSGEHLIRLINDLLDLSRAEIGELDLFPEAVSVAGFLAETFNGMVESLGDRMDLSWRLVAPDDLPTIEADPVRLRQVLHNLLHNAAKFTHDGLITLGAAVEPPHLHFWVADTGPGIQLELQQVIFQPFAKLERAGRRQDGAGLGLSITRRLVALHAGTITLESQPGRGSTFHVYLPLPTLSGRRVAPAMPAGRPLLWVISADDDLGPEIAALADRTHAAVRRISSRDDVDRLALEAPPTAIAWAVDASGGWGWVQIERLRAHPQLSQLPFLLYPGQSRRSSGAGVTDVLTRPAGQASLLDAIAALRPRTVDRPILVVDDDPGARDLTVRLIEQAFPGAPTTTAADGREALAWLQDSTPALIVLDLVMPELDGFEVLEQVRSDPRTRGVPVLVLTGKLLTLDELLRLNRGGAAYQRKGLLSAEEQAALLQTVLRRNLLPQATSEVTKRAVARIHEAYALDISRDGLAASCGVSAGYLSKIFRQEMGLSVTEYLLRLRVQMAQALLADERLTITEVASATGFTDPAYFSRVFHKLTGQSARDYRRASHHG